MNTTIFLCASMNFYRELVDIEEQLEKKGFRVTIPVSAGKMKIANDFEVSHFKDVYSSKQKGKFVQTNFANIAKSNAILVINNEKNGVQGYIGANVLMEIGLAFYLQKYIYILNPTEKHAPYNEELLAFNAICINGDLNRIK